VIKRKNNNKTIKENENNQIPTRKVPSLTGQLKKGKNRNVQIKAQNYTKYEVRTTVNKLIREGNTTSNSRPQLLQRTIPRTDLHNKPEIESVRKKHKNGTKENEKKQILTINDEIFKGQQKKDKNWNDQSNVHYPLEYNDPRQT